MAKATDVTVGGVTGGASDIFRADNLGAGAVSLLLDGGTNDHFPDNVWIDGLTVLPDESGVYLSFWSGTTLGTNNLVASNNDVVFFDLDTFEARMVFDYSDENPGLTAGIIALHAFSDDRMLVTGIFEDEMWLLEKDDAGSWSQEFWANGETFGFPANSVDIDAIAVPEPTSLALFVLGLLGLAGYRRRRRRN